jgi:hypothetical protein
MQWRGAITQNATFSCQEIIECYVDYSPKKFQSKLVSNIDFIQAYTEGFQNLWTAHFQFQKRNGVKLLEEAIKFLSDVIEIE